MRSSKEIIALIKALRTEKGISLSELARRAGVPKSTLSRYESLDREFPMNDVEKYADVLNVSPLYLLGVDDNKQLASHVYKFYKGGISAGLPESIEAVYKADDLAEIEIPDIFMNGYAGQDDILIITVNGNSMDKEIPHGSLVAIKKCQIDNLKKNDIVVFSDHGDFSMKRYINDEVNRRIIFRPDSTDDIFTDIIISYDYLADVRIWGKVVAAVINYG